MNVHAGGGSNPLPETKADHLILTFIMNTLNVKQNV